VPPSSHWATSREFYLDRATYHDFGVIGATSREFYYGGAASCEFGQDGATSREFSYGGATVFAGWRDFSQTTTKSTSARRRINKRPAIWTWSI
jgi:hypothetical protein